MSCAKGCRGPVKEPDSSRARASSLLAQGFLAEAVPAEETPVPVVMALLGTSLPTPREMASRTCTALRGGGCLCWCTLGETDVSSGRGLGPAQGPRQPFRSWMAPEHPSSMPRLPGGSVPLSFQ